MKPLVVLLGAFIISLLVFYFVRHSWQWSVAGRIGMSAMLLFTAIGHFAFSDGMQMMMPKAFPFKKALVLITGFIEIAAAIGLVLTYWHVTTGWWLIAFFIFILPANISAALRHVDYQKGTNAGNGPSYLWFRVPLQLLFIAWVYWFAIHL
jgi:uncharacterized membrane protein